MAPTIALGTIIFIDFDKTRKTAKPPIIQNIAVRVPDWNIPHTTAIDTKMKKILSFVILDMIPNIRNATAAAAAWQP